MLTAQEIREYLKRNLGDRDVKDIDQINDQAVKFICSAETFKSHIKERQKETSGNNTRIVLYNLNIDYSDHVRELYDRTISLSPVFIENVFVLEKVEFNGVFFDKDFTLTIEDTDEACVIFKNCHFMGKLKIRNNETNDHEEYFPKKTKLKSLKFIDCVMDTSNAKADKEDEYHGIFSRSNLYLRVGFLKVDNFVLKNLRVPNNAEVNIGECHFKNFRLSNFRNLGKFKLYKINVGYKEGAGNGTFQLDNTSIGDTDFQSLNLVSFKTRKIFDNIFSGIDYTNVQWEKPETDIKVGQFTQGERVTENENITEREKITKRAKKRDTYRVLKNVAQRNNDMQQAFAFYAKEVKWHRKLLALTAKCTNICKLRKAGELSKLFDRFTLFFGEWTNNYGQNWALPVGLILLSGAVFYAVLLWVLTGDVCRIFDSENWHKFFVFLNPTHPVKFIDVGCWGFRAYTIDFFFRVWEGALIYQTIQAFRKYSRKF